MEAHKSAVLEISSRIKDYHSRKEPFRIYHGSTNSTRKAAYERKRMVDTSGLAHVLQVDREKRTVLVEPNVPMDALIKETLKYGLIPPVVMEFPGITVGGGFAGRFHTGAHNLRSIYDIMVCEVRNISQVCDAIITADLPFDNSLMRTIFEKGGFLTEQNAYFEFLKRPEKVPHFATGKIMTASSTENSDLFYGAASSFGTIGVTTLLEIQLIESKTYVELTHYPVSSILDAQDRINDAIKDESVDYLDGMMFARDKGVICSGRLTNTPNSGVPIQRFTRPTDPWFYLHISRYIAKHNTAFTEAVPIVDYLFRYDRGGFWVARYAYRYFLTPFNRITRFLLDYFMHTRVMYHALHQSGLSNMYIIQDVAIPYPKAEEFMGYLDTNFKQYPIWLCPLKQSGKKTSTHALQIYKTTQALPETMLNFGVWGPGPTSRQDFVDWNRTFEHKVQELGGQKWLYAQTYYSEEEFYQIYKRQSYDELRKKYGAEYLPSVYDKVKVDFEKEQRAIRDSWKLWVWTLFWNKWPFAGLYGVWKSLLGGDYLLPKGERVVKEKVT